MKKSLSVLLNAGKGAVLFCALLVASAIVVSSCSKDEKVSKQEDEIELRFDIKVNGSFSNAGTKLVKTDWEVGDKIYLFFNVTTPTSYSAGYLTTENHVILTRNSSNKWDASTPSGKDEVRNRIGAAGKMYALYFPYGNVTISSRFQPSGLPNQAVGNNYFYAFYLTNDSDGEDYTVTTTGNVSTLTGTLNMSIPDGFVYFYIDAVDDGHGGKLFNEDGKYRLYVEGIKPAALTSWDAGFATLELGEHQPMWGYKYGGGIAFAGKMDDSWNAAADHQFIFFSDGDPALTKTFNSDPANPVTSMVSHKSIKLKAPMTSSGIANGWTRLVPVADVPTYTDIHGIKWADWNLGCTGLNDASYASGFRWSDILPDASGTMYNIGAVSLTGSYVMLDAARALLGSDWRMPSMPEIVDLVNNSNYSYQSSGEVSAGSFTKGGIVFTDKTNADHKIIFRTNGSSTGYYWTVTPKSGASKCARINTNGTIYGTSDSYAGYTRSNKCAVRPIYIGE